MEKYMKQTGGMVFTALLFMGCAIATGAENGEPSRQIVLGYYPSWERALPPSKINFKQFTHLCHAFASTDKNGNVKTGGNLPSRDLTALAHASGVRALISLGGMDSGNLFGLMMKNKAAAERFTSGVIQLVIDYEYDGIDIDWEFPLNEEDSANFTRMARRFREGMDAKKPGLLLTAAVSGVNWAGRWFNEKEIAPLFDFLNVMTYDMHGPWGTHAGYNSVIDAYPADREECRANSMSGQMTYWMVRKNLPKEKLLVGIPLYGRGFAVKKWGDPIQYKDKVMHPYVPFKEVSHLQKEGWRRHWDEQAGVPWLSKDGVAELITYDDERSAALKGGWAAQNGFAGIFFWEISQDYIGGENVLVRAATEGWKGRKDYR